MEGKVAARLGLKWMPCQESTVEKTAKVKGQSLHRWVAVSGDLKHPHICVLISCLKLLGVHITNASPSSEEWMHQL